MYNTVQHPKKPKLVLGMISYGGEEVLAVGKEKEDGGHKVFRTLEEDDEDFTEEDEELIDYYLATFKAW